MELLQLEYFMCIAEYESVSKAAEKLHVSQPSLSSSLRRLENELGAQLFTRRGRGIVLNDYGRFVLNNTKRMFELIKTIKIPSGHGEMEGRLSIGFQNYNELLLSLVDRFIDAHPNIVVDVYGGTLGEPFPLISYDYIVANADSKLAGLANSMPIETRNYYAVLPKDHPLAGRDEIHLKELKGERFCFLRDAKGDFEHAYYYCVEEGFKPHCDYATNSPFYKIRYVQQGKCVTFIPSGWYARYRQLENVVVIPLHGYSNKVEIRLYWSDDVASVTAREFLGFVLANLATKAVSFDEEVEQ